MLRNLSQNQKAGALIAGIGLSVLGAYNLYRTLNKKPASPAEHNNQPEERKVQQQLQREPFRQLQIADPVRLIQQNPRIDNIPEVMEQRNQIPAPIQPLVGVEHKPQERVAGRVQIAESIVPVILEQKIETPAPIPPHVHVEQKPQQEQVAVRAHIAEPFAAAILEQKIQTPAPVQSFILIEQRLQQNRQMQIAPSEVKSQQINRVPVEYKAQSNLPVESISPVEQKIQEKPSILTIPDELIQNKKLPHESLLNAIRCPITLEIFEDPVITTHGQTYDRKSISAWLANNETDPMTNLKLEDTTLVPNYAVKALVEGILKLYPDPKKTREEIEAEQKAISLLLQPMEKYAYATGLQAMTKNHQGIAQQILIKLRTELHILNRCDTAEMVDKLESVSQLINKYKPNKDKGDYLKALIQVEKNIKEHFQPNRTLALRKN